MNVRRPRNLRTGHTARRSGAGHGRIAGWVALACAALGCGDTSDAVPPFFCSVSHPFFEPSAPLSGWSQSCLQPTSRAAPFEGLVVVELQPTGIESCGEVVARHPLAADVAAYYEGQEHHDPERILCEVREVASEPDSRDGEGFYLDDFSEEVMEACGEESAVLRFTSEAVPAEDASVLAPLYRCDGDETAP